MEISVIGLGKLGLCTAACFAAAGHKVYGYDSNNRFRDILKDRRSPISETGIDGLLESAWPNLSVSDSCRDAVLSSDVTLIIVPTPSNSDGRFTNEYVINAFEAIAPSLKEKNRFHVIDVVSTVMPGSSEGIFVPMLEKLTGKKCGIEFGLAYNPEFIALGSVIHNFLNPDMVLIGVSDNKSAAMLKELYKSTCKSNPTIAVMSLVNAEITKISLNCYVTMKISYANALAAICEQVPGADIDVITSAIGADSRVGSKYLKGGLGFGGPCFPRDNIAFQAFAEEFGSNAILGKAVVTINKQVPRRLLEIIKSNLTPPTRIALCGLSYKADTHIIEESQSIMLAELLLAEGYEVAVHDPQSMEDARGKLRGAVKFACDPYEAVSGAGAMVLLADWPEYRQLDWARIARSVSQKLFVIDCWRIARHNDMSAFAYFPLGIGIEVKEPGD